VTIALQPSCGMSAAPSMPQMSVCAHRFRGAEIGGLAEMGFVPGSSLLLVVSDQSRGLIGLATGEQVTRGPQETAAGLMSRPPANGDGRGLTATPGRDQAWDTPQVSRRMA